MELSRALETIGGEQQRPQATLLLDSRWAVHKPMCGYPCQTFLKDWA